MKLNIKTSSGFKDELTFEDADPTLRGIRGAIAEALDIPWYQLHPVINLENNLKIGIKLDSDPSETLSEFIRRREGISINLDEVVRCSCSIYCSPGNRCETSYFNPLGVGLGGMQAVQAKQFSYLESVLPNKDQQEFVQNLVNEHGLNQRNYASRFAALNLESSSIPESFRDPITKQIMNAPVVYFNQCIYDLSTVSEKVQTELAKSSIEGKPALYVEHAIRLHVEMEIFLKQKEEALHQNDNGNRAGNTL
jgi:hypothetical protein